MNRAYNFCAGPAALPEPVLMRASEEMMDWQGSGCSVMEMSHRSTEIVAMTEAAEASLRRLMAIPDDYAVIFQQGGASQQFAAVPLNLAHSDDVVAYLNTGQWSKKAIAEAQRFTNVEVVGSSQASNFTEVPKAEEWSLPANTRYLHYCPNETIGGVRFNYIPEAAVPVVADMSSMILSEPIDVPRFGVIYAGAQKNIGPAGLAVIIVKKSLLGSARSDCPAMLDWQKAADNGSMYNTPPTFGIYLAGLVFEWIEAQGGLDAMAVVNRRKAAMLYDLIDTNDFYANPVEVESRSLMNVPFTLADSSLDKAFLADAEAARLLNLKGHRSVGGMRASIYNAVDESAVATLAEFMTDFAKRNG
ncbi:phosphoserine aminotransferase [Luminiphilus syltensis NOR5-1B]|uniref:Phosphoserine aminotransferase n=1 Tax=Luminiphilus syltensis NOR5-1B TaxID=565045 RepID=B8KX25_9GAMM|nr:3-phosphoserine/phosphohydroxythreonine transaminase [Luminiphilus syltensis]EED35624.1 phosphoserine aminotransferase [Luminiphilus syltensis NOR5-1B]